MRTLRPRLDSARRFVRRCAWLSLLAAVCGAEVTSAPAARAEAAASFALPFYTTNRLENGVTLLLMERRELPLISFVWLLRSGGGIQDPPGKEGVASLTAQMLRKGTLTRSAQEISEALDFAGASFSASATADYAEGSAEFLSKDTGLAVSLIADLLMHPSFPGEELDKMRKQEVDGLAEDKEVPNQVIGRYFRRALFAGHPYSRAVGGTETSLPGITVEDLKKFHAAHYAPGQLILAVVGDFNSEELRRSLGQAFAEWPDRPVTMRPLESPPSLTGRRALLVEKPDATQLFFRLGNVGLPRTSPDWVPLQVVNTLFGGRFTSMINSALRIESGLTYGARSYFSANPVPGEFAIGSYTKNETAGQALDLTLEVLKRLHREGFTEAQLQSAKDYIQGQFGPELETNAQLASRIADLEFFGLGAEEIRMFFARVNSVTTEQARELIKKYYPLDDFLLVLIGQKAVARPVAEKLAREIEEKIITAPGF